MVSAAYGSSEKVREIHVLCNEFCLSLLPLNELRSSRLSHLACDMADLLVQNNADLVTKLNEGLAAAGVSDEVIRDCNIPTIDTVHDKVISILQAAVHERSSNEQERES
jgi:hypothetical protein